MADMHCPKCGSSESKHWITCLLYPTPEGSQFKGQLICMSHCLLCDHHIKNGTSLEWCGYRLPQPVKTQPPELSVNALEMQMRRKLGKAESFYKRGKTRIGDQLSDEAAWLQRKIRRIKRNVQDA